MLQALIEGIAYRSREVLEAMGADGTVAQTIHIDGGMTQNKWICQCLANVTGRAMAVAAMPDATALGLCRMAARAAGLSLPDLPEPRLHHPEPGFTPLPERFAAARRSVQGWAQTCARAQL